MIYNKLYTATEKLEMVREKLKKERGDFQSVTGSSIYLNHQILRCFVDVILEALEYLK